MSDDSNDEKLQCDYKVSDLVTYADEFNFALPSLKIGIVIEVLDIEDFLYRDNHEIEREEYYKGFMKEWENYNRIRQIEQGPHFGYPEERERLLERTLKPSELSTKCLLRVLWNTGSQYIEHPEDLKHYHEENDDD